MSKELNVVILSGIVYLVEQFELCNGMNSTGANLPGCCNGWSSMTAMNFGIPLSEIMCNKSRNFMDFECKV